MSVHEATATDDGTDSENSVLTFLADHPRMIGVLFTVLLLLTQAGNVAAGDGASVAGP